MTIENSTSPHQQEKGPPLFKPTLFLHGGAGNIHRSRLPPELYERYRESLLTYLRSTADLLHGRDDDEQTGCSALDAAVHAVALMEDDELFNCGHGSVFTTAGTVEMEASVMVSSVSDDANENAKADMADGMIKRGAGVMMLKNVRYPIKLAKEVLLRTGLEGSDSSGGGSMHSQMAGPYVERLASDWGLEFKPDKWFWTKRRWDEHRQGLSGGGATIDHDGIRDAEGNGNCDEKEYRSQGTVGCVCLDKWGNLAVATSTGGLTNKFPGRIGDTPTLGAGFWAESWRERGEVGANLNVSLLGSVGKSLWGERASRKSGEMSVSQDSGDHRSRRRAVAVSGTGNGDSFLRVAAANTTAVICRLSQPCQVSLAEAVAAVAGPGGELQRSAGSRWGSTAEGTGGIIGIEAELEDDGNDGRKGRNTNSNSNASNVSEAGILRRGKVVFDFNGGGMFRAWLEEDENGVERERMMVFRDEYR